MVARVEDPPATNTPLDRNSYVVGQSRKPLPEKKGFAMLATDTTEQLIPRLRLEGLATDIALPARGSISSAANGPIRTVRLFELFHGFLLSLNGVPK